jgi:hypothetical protein
MPAAIPAPMIRMILVAALLASACAHEVVWLGDEPPAQPGLKQPLPFTVAVGVQAFPLKRIREDAFLEDFVGRLKSSRVFQGVIFPVEPGFETIWELKLVARESAFEPNSNIWKSALATAFLPAAFALYLESEYTLDLEALLTRRKVVVASYPVQGKVRYRYQRNANLQVVDLEGIQTIVDRTSRQLLAKIADDAERLLREDLDRAGR